MFLPPDSSTLARDAFRDFAAEAATMGGDSSPKTSRLADLFKAPLDMMARGDFDQVKIMLMLLITLHCHFMIHSTAVLTAILTQLSTIEPKCRQERDKVAHGQHSGSWSVCLSGVEP